MAASVGRHIAVVLVVILISLIPNTLLADDCERVLSVLKKAEAHTDTLADYTLTLDRQERVRGRLLPMETMFIKWKRPFSIYTKNLTGKHKNREIIYVKGKNSDKMIVSLGGIFEGLPVKIAPDSARAKKESRHTITEAGLPAILNRMISLIEDEERRIGSALVVTYVGEEYCSPRKVIHLRIEKSAYAPRTDITLDAQTLLPASIVSCDKDGSVLECYTYRDIKTNVGLADADFDPKNPDYHF